MIASTLGFIYTPDFKKVLLIEKLRPTFHKGKLNGLGGKCEPGESSRDCVSREVTEESSLVISTDKWQEIASMYWAEWDVVVFAARYHGAETDAITLTDGKIGWYSVEELPKNVISNLPWLIPLGIDCLQNNTPVSLVIRYQK